MKYSPTTRMVSRAAICLLAGALVTPTAAVAQEAPSPEEEIADESAEATTTSTVVDLGRIDLEFVQLTRNQTLQVALEVRLLLDSATNKQTLADLEKWRHRLREQVLVAVRLTEAVEFLEPELQHLRKHILYRINRTLREPLVQDVLLADFTFKFE